MKFLIFILGSLLTQVSYSLPSLSCEGRELLSGTKASQSLQALQDSYGAIKGLKADFVQQSYMSALDVSEQARGTVVFDKPGKMRWEYTAPEEQVFVADGESVWFYQPQDNQVVVDSFNNLFTTDIPVTFLMGMGELSSQFSVEKGCQNELGTVLWLIPREQDSRSDELQKMAVLVSQKGNLPVGVSIIDISMNSTTFYLNNLKTETKITPKTFTLSIPDGTDLIDRRRN